MPNTTKAPLSEKIMSLAARPCGMVSSDLPDSTPEAVCTRAAQLIKKGLLHKVKVSHRSVRFFASRRHADTFAATLAGARPPSSRQVNTAQMLFRIRAQEARDSASRRSGRDDRPSINPNNVKPVEVPGYPGFDTRFAVTGPIVGGFKTMGIGRYL